MEERSSRSYVSYNLYYDLAVNAIIHCPLLCFRFLSFWFVSLALVFAAFQSFINIHVFNCSYLWIEIDSNNSFDIAFNNFYLYSRRNKWNAIILHNFFLSRAHQRYIPFFASPTSLCSDMLMIDFAIIFYRNDLLLLLMLKEKLKEREREMKNGGTEV